ncbi:hypothetical protein BC835DRAFT_1307429 [Cytidiella melzeri]|nr:hypothetical protein BC835DRAFT_1307429 [Cytidiella melzeri]
MYSADNFSCLFNPAGTQSAAYAFGTATPLPPTPNQLAFCSMYQHLGDNSPRFSFSSQRTSEPLLTPSPTARANVNSGIGCQATSQGLQGTSKVNRSCLRILVSLNTTNAGLPNQQRLLKLPLDIEPQDVLDRIQAHMDVSLSTKLAYRISVDRGPAKELQTEPATKSTRLQKKINAAAKENKPQDDPLDERFELLKTRLHWAQHSRGQNPRWCMVEGDGEHVALTIHDLTLWARQSFTNGESLDQVGKNTPSKGSSPRQRNSSYDASVPTTPAAPALRLAHRQFRPSGSSCKELLLAQQQTIQLPVTPATPPFLKAMESDESDDNYEPQADTLTIAVLLTALDHKYPALDFPQYAQPLTDRGICYVRSAATFDERYLREKVGMADGAVRLFLEHAARMMRKRKARRPATPPAQEKSYRTYSVEI